MSATPFAGSRPQTAVPALILAASVAILGGAFAFQHLGGLEPCPLCVLQRYPYGAAIVLSAAALVLARWVDPALPVAAAGVAFLAGAALAGFHVGVEEGWWPGLSTCAGGSVAAMGLEDINRGAARAAAPQCDDVPWALFGVSLAGFNLVLSAGLAAFSLWGAWRLWRRA